MKHRVREAIDEEERGSDYPTVESEWDEYRRRFARGECTCDLLDPYGHVMCPECNEGLA